MLKNLVNNKFKFKNNLQEAQIKDKQLKIKIMII